MGDLLKKCAEIVDEKEKLMWEKKHIKKGIEQLEHTREYYQRDIERLKLKIIKIDKRLKELP